MKDIENVIIQEMEKIKIEKCDNCENTMLEVSYIELLSCKCFYEKEDESNHHIEIIDNVEEYIKEDKKIVIYKVICNKCKKILYHK